MVIGKVDRSCEYEFTAAGVDEQPQSVGNRLRTLLYHLAYPACDRPVFV
jgi:hypothetical protein